MSAVAVIRVLPLISRVLARQTLPSVTRLGARLVIVFYDQIRISITIPTTGIIEINVIGPVSDAADVIAKVRGIRNADLTRKVSQVHWLVCSRMHGRTTRMTPPHRPPPSSPRWLAGFCTTVFFTVPCSVPQISRRALAPVVLSRTGKISRRVFQTNPKRKRVKFIAVTPSRFGLVRRHE